MRIVIFIKDSFQCQNIRIYTGLYLYLFTSCFYLQDAKKYLEDWNAQPGVVPKVYDPEQEVNFDGNYEGAMERLY